MHELLQPGFQSFREAAGECELWLRQRRPALGTALRLLPAERRLDLAAVVSWFQVTLDVGRSAASRLEVSHELGLLDEARAAAFRGEADTVAGAGLAFAARRCELDAEDLQRHCAAVRDELFRSSFESRDALLGHARSLAGPVARAVLGAWRLDTERRRVLAEAAGIAEVLLDWTAGLVEHFERGTLLIPMDELLRCGVQLNQITERRFDANFQELVAGQCVVAREWLHKGWGLADDLGPVHGRYAAAYLRGIHATLRAIERVEFDVLTTRVRPTRSRRIAARAAGLVIRARPRFIAAD